MISKEKFFRTAEISAPLLALAYLANSGMFPRHVKEKVHHRQKGRCAHRGCNYVGKLQSHHILPKSKNGADTEDNAVGLCPAHHAYWDDKALNESILFDNIPIKNAPLKYYDKKTIVSRFGPGVFGGITKRRRR